MRLKFEQTGFSPTTRRTWLDDLELKHVIDLTLEVPGDGFTRATLTIAPDQIEIDAETAAHLIAAIRELAIHHEVAQDRGTDDG
jgi:hypothetical protein